MIDIIGACIVGVVVGWNLSRWSKPPPADSRLWQTRILHHPNSDNRVIVQRFEPRLFRKPDWVQVGPDFYRMESAQDYKRVLEDTDSCLKEENYIDD